MELQHYIIITWVIFALIVGVLEARFFNKHPYHVKIKGYNIHNWLTAGRALIATPLCALIFFKIGWAESFLMGAIFTLVFPFFHDGIYYTTREILNKGSYPKFWIDQSDLTDARLSFSFPLRAIFLVAALLMFPY